MTRHTILIVDDTPDHLSILRRMLSTAGFRVLEARSGAEAAALAQDDRPDLILAALAPPGQPEWQAAQQLAADASQRQIPVLGTTVYSTLLNAPRARAIGCADYVEKPFSLDELLHHIRRLLPAA
jgi:CheY-like chemotaxis protein